MCAHAEYITFGRTEGIGHVPMRNLLLLAQLKVLGVCVWRMFYVWQNREHWVCAYAEYITFGRSEGIGCVSMQNLFNFGRAEGIGHVPMQNL